MFAHLFMHICLLLKQKKFPNFNRFSSHLKISSFKSSRFDLKREILNFCFLYFVNIVGKLNYSSCSKLNLFPKHLNFENIKKQPPEVFCEKFVRRNFSFVKFLRTSFLQNIPGRLLLVCGR